MSELLQIQSDTTDNVYSFDAYRIHRYNTGTSTWTTFEDPVMQVHSFMCGSEPNAIDRTFSAELRVDSYGNMYATVLHFYVCSDMHYERAIRKYDSGGNFLGEVVFNTNTYMYTDVLGDADDFGFYYMFNNSAGGTIKKYDVGAETANPPILLPNDPNIPSIYANVFAASPTGNLYARYVSGTDSTFVKYNNSGSILWYKTASSLYNDGATTHLLTPFAMVVSEPQNAVYFIENGSSNADGSLNWPARIHKYALDFTVPDPSASPSPSPAPSLSPSLSPTPPIPSLSPSPSPSPTFAPSVTPSPTVISTNLITPTPSMTSSPTLVTPTATQQETVTPTDNTTLNPSILITENNCPAQILQFSVTPTIVKPGEYVTISWHIVGAQKMRYQESGMTLPPTGTFSFVPENTTSVTLVADAGICLTRKQQQISVVTVYPWTQTTATVTAALVVDVLGLPYLTSALKSTSKVGFMSGIINAQGNLFYALMNIFQKKKRKSYGVVYDAKTKKPVSRAIVRVYYAGSTTEIADTTVTDARGIFRLLLKEGSYSLEVVASGYTFPSRQITTQDDHHYGNAYIGGTIEVKNANEQLRISIPLDPEQWRSNRILVWLQQVIGSSFEFLSNIIFWGGLVYGIYATLVFPHLYNTIILGIYTLIGIAKITLQFESIKTVGTLTDEKNLPIKNVELAIYDADFHTILYRTFTSQKGEYSFVVPTGTYYMSVADTTYSLISKGALVQSKRCVVTSKQGELQYITEHLKARKK